MKSLEDIVIKQKIASLPAWGVWIEIFCKYFNTILQKSLPAWGVWIEIYSGARPSVCLMSLPAWGVWIEMPLSRLYAGYATSLPAWGVWIEIFGRLVFIMSYIVAPRMGSVD